MQKIMPIRLIFEFYSDELLIARVCASVISIISRWLLLGVWGRGRFGFVDSGYGVLLSHQQGRAATEG